MRHAALPSNRRKNQHAARSSSEASQGSGLVAPAGTWIAAPMAVEFLHDYAEPGSRELW